MKSISIHLLIILISSVEAMRAWACSGKNQKELVDRLREAQIIIHEKVAQVMYNVDRRHFCPQDPYQDAPQAIGLGQTISAPHMHAHVLEEIFLSLEKSSSTEFNLLDVGVGSGYLAACLGEWVHSPKPILGKTGKVHGIDVWPKLVEKCKQNIDHYNPSLRQRGTVDVTLGDGWKGMKDQRFDAIHVGAAADEFPVNLMTQLKVGGILIVPVGPDGGAQILYRVEKLEESPQFVERNFAIQQLLGVRYVPLIRPGQHDNTI